MQAHRLSTAASKVSRKSLVTPPIVSWEVTVTAPILRFPDVQKVLVGVFTTLLGAGHAGTETPTNLDQVLPFVRVMRIGGPSGQVDDSAQVEVDVFGTTYAQVEPLAEQIRQLLCGPPPPSPFLDRIACDVGPCEAPWGDGPTRRWNAAYQVVSRRHRM